MVDFSQMSIQFFHILSPNHRHLKFRSTTETNSDSPYHHSILCSASIFLGFQSKTPTSSLVKFPYSPTCWTFNHVSARKPTMSQPENLRFPGRCSPATAPWWRDRCAHCARPHWATARAWSIQRRPAIGRGAPQAWDRLIWKIKG